MKRVLKDVKQLSKGQKADYELLQLSHRLEKGLLHLKPKPLWGWDKAERMAYLMNCTDDGFSRKTAGAVLSAYLVAKESSEHEYDREKARDFRNRFVFDPHYNLVGGIQKVEHKSFEEEEQQIIRQLFDTRHSCREFSDKEVPDDRLREAVGLALRSPSACNRQPFKVYVIKPRDLEHLIGRPLQYSGNRVLVITGDVRAFTSKELLDWLVSPSIFAGYLTLSLHALNIGSCIVRKDLVGKSAYNNALRSLTGMEESEQIVLEMYVGYYKDDYRAPISNRHNPGDVVRFI